MVYDVAIVGAGPAGIAASLVAAGHGFSVALIERRQQLAPLTRACSEGLLYDEPYYGASIRIDRERGRIEFSPSGLTLRYTGQIRDIPYFDAISYRGNRMHLVRDDGKPIQVVFDKARYLEENLDDAVARGVCFFPNHTVIDLDLNPEKVSVVTHRTTFSARFLIAADGHNSFCARCAGYNQQRTFYGTLTAVYWHVEGLEHGDPGHLHLLEGVNDPSVFCICPRVEEGQWSIVISGYDRSADYTKRFDEVTKHSVLAPLFGPQVRIQRQLACILNLFQPLADPCTKNMYIVGDGAWFGQTSNSHAALTGAQAAECISKVLSGECSRQDAAETYRRWWRTCFYDGWRTPGANIFEHLTRDEIDELFACLPPEITGSLEPGKAQRLMAALFQQLMPRLQEKHQRLYERILSVQQLPAHNHWAEKRKHGIAVRSLIRAQD